MTPAAPRRLRQTSVWTLPEQPHRRRALRAPEPAYRRSDLAGGGWVPGIIEQLLTRYSRPGDTLLLVPFTPRRPHSPIAPGRRRNPRPTARIPHQAGHAADQLVSAFALTADPTWLAYLQARAPAAGRRLQVLTGTLHLAETDSHPAPGEQPAAAAVILTTVQPHQPDRFEQVAWRQLLRPGGILAVLTHSDHDAGQLRDTTTPLIRTAQRHGLTWLDHIIITGRPIWPAGEDHAGSRRPVADASEQPAAPGAVAAERRRGTLRPVAHAATRQRATGRASTEAPTPIGGPTTRHGHDDLLIFLAAAPPPRRVRTRRGIAR